MIKSLTQQVKPYSVPYWILQSLEYKCAEVYVIRRDASELANKPLSAGSVHGTISKLKIRGLLAGKIVTRKDAHGSESASSMICLTKSGKKALAMCHEKIHAEHNRILQNSILTTQ